MKCTTRLRACVLIAAVLGAGCGEEWGGAPPYDESFEIPRTAQFAPALSSYGLYASPMQTLQPTDGTVQYSLAAELFTDYAKKQRLVRLPAGATASVGADGRVVYPEGTLLAKTFYYPADLRTPSEGLRIIETRLLIKADGIWNAATYVWNAEQTDATLLLDGTTTAVSWIDTSGQRRSTTYAVPHEGECVTCHQIDGASAYIGPTLAGLNRTVSTDAGDTDQLARLTALGVFEDGAAATAPVIPDYNDTAASIDERARAYLHANCAHCHNPTAWDAASDRPLDLRYDTAFADTGISRKAGDLGRVLESGEMPYLGTTVLDAEGVRLVLDYLDSL